MELRILENRVRVLSLAKEGLSQYTHALLKLLLLPQRTKCKFFSLTETPEDYTLILDEEGFKDLPPSGSLQAVEAAWLVLNVSSNGGGGGGGGAGASGGVFGVTKIAKSVIAPLARHGVSVLMLSTYQTDFILIRERDLPLVLRTLSPEFEIYREINGETVAAKYENDDADADAKFAKMKPAVLANVHPVQSPPNRFCILSVAPETLPAVATILLDVLFYARRLRADDDADSFTFFAFSLIEGYISIVMDAEDKKKFPSDLLLTSSSGELWRMVRIGGGQPLGFDECGIVAQIALPLADADISAYYISTFNFDHALVPEDGVEDVTGLLRKRQEISEITPK